MTIYNTSLIAYARSISEPLTKVGEHRIFLFFQDICLVNSKIYDKCLKIKLL